MGKLTEQWDTSRTPTEPPDMPEGTRGRGSQEGVKTEVLRGPNRAAEATGDNSDETRRPEKPDDSPNEVEGTRVEEVETSMLQASKDVQEGPGDGNDDEGRPGVPDEPPDEPYGEAHDPEGIQVEPGGEISEAERIERAAHEDAGAEVNGEAAETRRDAEVEVENAGTRRGTSVEGERDSTRNGRQLTKKMISATKRTSSTYLVHPQSHLHHTPAQTSPRDERTNPRASSSRGRGEAIRAAMSDTPAMKRTR